LGILTKDPADLAIDLPTEAAEMTSGADHHDNGRCLACSGCLITL